MAAAEYYTAGSQPTPAPSSPYQQPQRPQGAMPMPPSTSSQFQASSHAPPPYNEPHQEQKPNVHFAGSPRPSHQQRPSFSGQAPIPIPTPQHRPSFSNQPPTGSFHRPSISNQSPNLSQHNVQQYPQQLQPFHGPPSRQSFQGTPPRQNSYHGTPPQQHSYHGTPPVQHSYHGTPPQSGYLSQPPAMPQHMRPYMNGNQSQCSLSSGYSSDPEPRRHRRRHHKEDREIKEATRKPRSRSTTADGFIGAAGGGLIGDLIFPGLGTVGGALAGWLGGKDYGKHRKHREEKLEKKQENWERKHGSGSSNDDRRHEGREQRSYERHRNDY